SWFRPNPLPTIAVLGLGANVQLHSTPVAVEVSVTHADHGRSGTHHLAYVEGVCVRQRVQHRARQQAIDDRFAERLSKSSPCRLSPLSGTRSDRIPQRRLSFFLWPPYNTARQVGLR